MATPGRLIRSVDVPLSGGTSTTVALREVPGGPGVLDGCVEAGLVLAGLGCDPFSAWARFLSGPGAEDEPGVLFVVGGVGTSASCRFFMPWLVGHDVVGKGGRWDEMPGWVAREAGFAGHDEVQARAAAAFLAGVVLGVVSEAWARALVLRACSLMEPSRVADLAVEQVARQVVES